MPRDASFPALVKLPHFHFELLLLAQKIALIGKTPWLLLVGLFLENGFSFI